MVLSNGGAVHLPFVDRVAAVLECWLGGQAGAGGMVDVLFGDAEPGGRLAESIPEHVAQLPADRNFPGLARQVEYREGHFVGYRFHDAPDGVPARFGFGHGLCYTSFQWDDVAVDGDGTELTVSVRVTNTGSRVGSDVVQVYVRDQQSSVPRPDKELAGFAKVRLEPGESEVVTIALDRRSFAVWDVVSGDWLVEAGRFDVVVARSSTDVVATVSREVASEDRVTPVPTTVGLVMDDAEFEARLGRPIPVPPPLKPFHRNSTLEDLETTFAGRVLSRIIVTVGLRRAAVEFPDADVATQAMIRAALREGPSRGLVLLSGGQIRFPMLDALLAAFNRDWAGARRALGDLRHDRI